MHVRAGAVDLLCSGIEEWVGVGNSSMAGITVTASAHPVTSLASQSSLAGRGMPMYVHLCACGQHGDITFSKRKGLANLMKYFLIKWEIGIVSLHFLFSLTFLGG